MLLKNEQIFKSNVDINYIYMPAKHNTNHLVVVFSGFASDKAKVKYTYNYMRTLEDVDCHKLFILDNYGERGCYYLGQNMSFEVEKSIIDLIEHIASTNNISKKNIITAGSSKGGSAGMYFALKYDLGNCIVGAPQTKIGDYIASCATDVLEYVAGGINNTDNIGKLNRLISDNIERNKFTKVDILTSEKDWQFKGHIKPIIGINDNIKVSIDETMECHGDIAKVYPLFLIEKLRQVIEKLCPEDTNTQLDEEMPINGFNVSIKHENYNKIVVKSFDSEENEYAYYVYYNGRVIEKFFYTKNTCFAYYPSLPGIYTVQVFKSDKNGEKESKFTEEVEFKGIQPDLSKIATKPKRQSIIASIKEVVREIWSNKQRMTRIALFDYKLLNKDSYLGQIWNILNPLIQIGTYWFVFGIGIRSGAPVKGHPFLIWMLCGLIPWFFVSTCITTGASSIYSKARLMLTLKYPISTMPLSTILVSFYQHIAVLGILVLLLFVHGYFPNLYWLNLMYYFIFEIAFLVSLAMVTSVLTMIARDFQKLINSLIRLLFYITPILWTIDNLSYTMQRILQLNPVLYIVNGFRDSLLYQTNFWEHLDKMAFFWVMTLALFTTGCVLQRKFKDQFIDML